jgi:transcriptional regulator PpsR
MLDMNAVIKDVTLSNTVAGEFVKTWLGRSWIDTVAEGGVEKVRNILDDVRSRGVSAYRPILQRFPSGLELPIEYTAVRLGEAGGFVAIGRDLNASSELQSRLVAAQQAMERDYWKLRDVETRYRLLFDASNEAVLVLTEGELRVADANPAAIRTLGLTKGWDFLGELSPRERDAFRSMLARVNETGRAPGGVFHIGSMRAPWIIRASLMNDDQIVAYMIQLVPVNDGRLASPLPEPVDVASLLHRNPDGFVVLDRDGFVQQANPAFLGLVQVGSEAAVLGQPIDRWFHQPEAQIDALLGRLRQPGGVQMLMTTLAGELGANTEVEISFAGDSDGDFTLVGVTLRDVAARTATTGDGSAPPLSLPQTDGKTPLKDLVRKAVEVVERHYLESALATAKGNRTAAAELLGLSRQSLYSKLNRYSLDGGLDVAPRRNG